MSRLQVQLPAICVCNRTATSYRRFSQNNRNAATVLIYHASRCKFAPTEINLYGKTNGSDQPFASPSISHRLLSSLSPIVRDVRLARKQCLPILDAKLERLCNCVIRIDNCPTSRRSQHWQRKDLVMSQLIILLS